MSTIGAIEVTIRIRLNADVTLEEARTFVQEMDYEIKDTTGKLSIESTEIVSDNVEDEGIIGMDDCPPDMDDCPPDYEVEDENAEEDQDRWRGTYGPEYKNEKF